MKLMVGTRGSKLALAQSNHVIALLQERFPGLDFEVKVIKTKGDKLRDAPLSKIGGKGIFVKEIDEAVAQGRVDFAVHSMKDLPTKLHKDLALVAVPPREDPCDVFISREDKSLGELPSGSVIGTSSLRRRAELLHIRRDFIVKELRGNVDTRMRKLSQGAYDAIVMAKAGIRRLGLEETITHELPVEEFLPAVGQGAIAIVARRDCKNVSLLEAVNHLESFHKIIVERAFLERIGGGCQVPLGVLTTAENGKQLRIKAAVYSVDGSEKITAEAWGRFEEAERVGRKCAKKLLDRGAGEFLGA
jgi:hydroxymethylbilane synthase